MKLKIIRSWEDQQQPKLLPVHRIIAESIDVTKLSGIYFLINSGTVVYVGATTNYHERIGRHLAKRKIIFDGVFFLPVENSEEMWRLESHYIHFFNCEANKVR